MKTTELADRYTAHARSLFFAPFSLSNFIFGIYCPKIRYYLLAFKQSKRVAYIVGTAENVGVVGKMIYSQEDQPDITERNFTINLHFSSIGTEHSETRFLV